MRPHDHMGWVFAGPNEFAAVAAPYLTEGAALGERVMYVAEDPHPDDMSQLATHVNADALRVASIAEIYGASGVVDPARQLATFMAELADALAAGYTGLRVAADNSSLVSDETQMKAWTEWEVVADHTIAAEPFTGLVRVRQGQGGHREAPPARHGAPAVVGVWSGPAGQDLLRRPRDADRGPGGRLRHHAALASA